MGCLSGKTKKVNNTVQNPIQNTRNVQTVKEIRSRPVQEAQKSQTQKPQEPLPYNPFWATSTVLALQAKLADFLRDVKKGKGSPAESVDTIQTILKNIKNDFQNPKFKTIKKANKRFSTHIGRFKSGVPLMLALGFAETADLVYLPEEILRSHIQLKLSDFNIAYKNLP